MHTFFLVLNKRQMKQNNTEKKNSDEKAGFYGKPNLKILNECFRNELFFVLFCLVSFFFHSLSFFFLHFRTQFPTEKRTDSKIYIYSAASLPTEPQLFIVMTSTISNYCLVYFFFSFTNKQWFAGF